MAKRQRPVAAVAIRTSPAAAWLAKYGLAVCCIVAPLVLAVGIFSLTYNVLISPRLYGENAERIVFTYEPATAVETEAARPAAANPAPGQPAKVSPDAAIYLPALHYAGRVSFASASVSLYIVSIVTLVFSAVTLCRTEKPWPTRNNSQWPYVIVPLIIWSVVAAIIAFYFSNPHGRYLVVRDLLNKADTFPSLASFVTAPFGYAMATGDTVEAVVHANTVIALVSGRQVAQRAVFHLDPRRHNGGRIAYPPRDLALLPYSRFGVFRHGLVQQQGTGRLEPLQIVRAGEAKAQRPIADSLVMQFGAIGTAATFAAFTPAIAAWMLDVASVKSGPAAEPAGVAAGGDNQVFAPLSTVTAVLATLAPILASPVADSVKTLVGAISK